MTMGGGGEHTLLIFEMRKTGILLLTVLEYSETTMHPTVDNLSWISCETFQSASAQHLRHVSPTLLICHSSKCHYYRSFALILCRDDKALSSTIASSLLFRRYNCPNAHLHRSSVATPREKVNNRVSAQASSGIKNQSIFITDKTNGTTASATRWTARALAKDLCTGPGGAGRKPKGVFPFFIVRTVIVFIWNN